MSDMKTVSGLEFVRRRPGMYIGALDSRGVHHIVLEVVANALDEFLANPLCTRIRVRTAASGVVVEDDGRGIPVESTDEGEATLTKVLTTLHNTPTADGHHPHVHLSLHGVGIACVNALSSELTVTVGRPDGVHRQRFRRGNPVSDVNRIGPPAWRGTRVQLTPDPEVFGEASLDRRRLRDALRDVAMLAAIDDRRVTLYFDEDTFHFPRGLADGLRASTGLSTPVFHVAQRVDLDVEVWVELACGFGARKDPGVRVGNRSWVSCAATCDGGAHVEGFWLGVNDVLGGQIDAKRHMTVWVHVGLFDPEFGGPTKDWLESPEARDAVRKVVNDRLPMFLETHPEARVWDA